MSVKARLAPFAKHLGKLHFLKNVKKAPRNVEKTHLRQPTRCPQKPRGASRGGYMLADISAKRSCFYRRLPKTKMNKIS